jgi:hypothetical protein
MTKCCGPRALLLLLFAAASIGSACAEPSVFPTGTTRYDPAKADNVFVIFSGADDITHLIDMDGHEVHRWKARGFPSIMLNPALVGGARGHILVQTSTADGAATGALPGLPAIFNDRTVGELDWNGKIVWNWGTEVPGGLLRQHHDIRRLPNGDTLILANIYHHLPGFKLPKMLDDAIYDVSPQGRIVWRWVISDHLDELGFTPVELRLVHQSPSPDYFHINDMAPLGPNKWFDAGDKRFAPDNIMVDSRNANFIVIIDRTTGHIVWRLGPDYPHYDAAKTKLPRPVDQISGQHDAHLIPPGLPGAGDLLVFDNQGTAGYPSVPLSVERGSRVLQIDPTTKQIVWGYSAVDSRQPGWAFHSPFISDARRLPNGNTFIDEGINGRFFQVTPAGEIVWEYVSPFKGGFPNETSAARSSWVYRAQPVPYSWVPSGTPHDQTEVRPQF